MDHENNVLYCRLETPTAVPEYGEDLSCARFIGVRPEEFNAEAFGEGISAIVLDAVWQDRLGRPFAPQYRGIDAQFLDDGTFVLSNQCEHPQDCKICFDYMNSWYRIEFMSDPGGRSYSYPAFAADDPVRLTLLSIQEVPGPVPPSFPEYRHMPSPSLGTPFSFSAFEVGQGMASLVYNDSDGFLVDAGAGTPIKRPAYLGNHLSQYDLRTLLNTRQVRFFLSHGDSDHWRMLGWDPALRTNIVEYIVPDGMRSIAFFDRTVRPQVFQLSSHLGPIPLGHATSLSIYRTRPSVPTSNNDGLIAVFEKGGEKVLAAGDCVYKEMLRDTDATVSQLPYDDYAVLVVPHHGDDESAQSVPAASPRVPGTAFFSAGNDPRYLHPRASSENAHAAQLFTNHVNKNPKGITEFPLL